MRCVLCVIRVAVTKERVVSPCVRGGSIYGHEAGTTDTTTQGTDVLHVIIISLRPSSDNPALLILEKRTGNPESRARWFW